MLSAPGRLFRPDRRVLPASARRPEVPLTHGDYAPAETGFAAQESGTVRDGVRLSHAGSVAEAAPAARTAALERSGRGDHAGRADRAGGDSDSAWDSSREQVADSVTIQTERVEFARSW